MEASNCYVELGEEYRRASNLHSSLKYYMKGAELAEKLHNHENTAMCNRAITEITVSPPFCNNTKARKHGKKYLDATMKTANVHLIQLAYQVMGWMHLQIYLNSDPGEKSMLEEGRMWCEKSLTHLLKNAVAIDSDKEAVNSAQDSKSRRARLHQLLSQIFDKLNLPDKAFYYHNKAMAYASRADDRDLQYRCLLSKLEFCGDQRLKTAIELVHVTANLELPKSCEAKFILAKEKIKAKDFPGAKWDLVSMLASKDFEKLENDDQCSFQTLLIHLYKSIERLKVIDSSSSWTKMKVNEKIADGFCETSRLEEFKEIGLDFYKKMLKHAKTNQEKRKALFSVAITAKELEHYEESFNAFVEIEKLEAQMNLSSIKRAETAVFKLGVAIQTSSVNKTEILSFFENAEKLAVTSQQKKDIYEYMLEFMGFTEADEQLKTEIESKLGAIENIDDDGNNDDDSDGSDEQTAENNYWDELDNVNDSQILIRCLEEANQRSIEDRMKQEKDKKINLYGETRLHEAARGNDSGYLKKLVKMGYNVNAKDEGGWTPLHEAVNALKLENVQILVLAGACMNIQSNEGTISEDGVLTDSGSLTPLMEACDRGATAIASFLIERGANVSIKNRDEWTALDFLRNAINRGNVEEEDVSEAEKIITVMRNKLEKANITVREKPPEKKLNVTSAAKTKLVNEIKSSRIDPNVANLYEYKKALNNLSRSSAHGETDELLDDDDDECDMNFLSEDDESCINIDHDENHLVGVTKDYEIDSAAIRRLPSICKKRLSVPAQNTHLSNRKYQEIPITKKRKRSYTRVCFDSVAEEDSEAESSSLDECPMLKKSVSGQNIDEHLGATSSSKSIAFGSENIKIISGSPNSIDAKKKQVFIKISFKTSDGVRLKTKGMPFTLDDTPIEMVLDSTNSLNCIISGWSRPSAAQIYSKQANRLMSNVLRAFNAAANGCLDLREMNIGDDKAVFDAIDRAHSDISELHLDFNALSIAAVDCISKSVRNMKTLGLSCCALKSASIQKLIANRSSFSQLLKLDLSYNDLSEEHSDYLIAFIELCPILKHLQLSSCNLSPCVIEKLVQQSLKINHLESIDLSFNHNVQSKHAQLLAGSHSIKELNLDATGIIDFLITSEQECGLEVISLAMCPLANPSDTLTCILNKCKYVRLIDFSATDCGVEVVELFLKSKLERTPSQVTTLSLRDCSCLATEIGTLINSIQSMRAADIPARLELSTKLKEDLTKCLDCCVLIK